MNSITVPFTTYNGVTLSQMNFATNKIGQNDAKSSS